MKKLGKANEERISCIEQREIEMKDKANQLSILADYQKKLEDQVKSKEQQYLDCTEKFGKIGHLLRVI